MYDKNMFFRSTFHFLGDFDFARGGSKFNLGFLRSVHFWLINCSKLTDFLAGDTDKYPNFQVGNNEKPNF